MCGVFGVVTSRGRKLTLNAQACVAMGELLAHRGPDAAGSSHDGHVAFAHRRLSLADPAGGAQPFRSTALGPRVILTWSGEVYNHNEIRRTLQAEGAVFHTRSDTETLATLLSMRGTDGLALVRGMYAIAAWFVDSDELVLARDPFGMVPLYYSEIAVPSGVELVFASEIRAITAHPMHRPEPDFASVQAFLEMPRRTYGARTLFRGVFAVEPGEVRRYALAGERVRCLRSHRIALPTAVGHAGLADAAWLVREAVTESIESHLGADAPVCAMLSGGIDSTVIASVARQSNPRLATFAVGAQGDAAHPNSDLFAARHVATLLGTEHREIAISGERFVSAWEQLLTQGGHPITNPSEVAIALLGSEIAPHAKAALSGEGADELFGGYGAPIEATRAWIDGRPTHHPEAAAEFYRSAFGWAPRAVLGELLRAPAVEKFAGHLDDPLGDLLEESCRDAGDLSTLDAHLAVQRSVNLSHLLERLDMALMRTSVQPRSPFSDRRVLDAVLRGGGAHLIDDQPGSGDRRSTGTVTGTIVTKRVLRRAFGDVLPPEIGSRPKASFPLPFESWIAAQTHWVDGPIASELFTPAARTLVREQAMQHWRLAWPVLNVARWLDSTFG